MVKIMRLFLNVSVLLLFLFINSGDLRSQSLSDLSFGTDETFEIITWNIEFFPKQGKVTVDSVREIIKALDADIIGLQEIEDTTDFREVLNEIPDYELYIVDGFYNGLAYACKKSTVQVNALYKIYNSSAFWNVLPRSPVVMEVSYNNEELIIINNHFKCCGDGDLEIGNFDDEEGRRYAASSLIKDYIDTNFSDKEVILIGDLNDNIVDVPADNVFQLFIDDPINYEFADMGIAGGTSAFWSYPNWPSHLDHILITNELFDEFEAVDSEIKTFRIGDFMLGGFDSYENKISDHRPVGLKMRIGNEISDLENTFETNISLSPNPNNGSMSIDLTSFPDDVRIEITDVSGRAIYSSDFKGNQLINLDLVTFPGLYFLVVKSKNKSGISKFIIEN